MAAGNVWRARRRPVRRGGLGTARAIAPAAGLLFFLLAACLLPGPARALEKVCVQLLWVHQAQFAGIYVAQDQGLYQAAGLEVRVEQGGPGVAPMDKLEGGQCDFALAWLADGLQSKSRGRPLLNLAQLVQKSGLVLVAYSDSGIESVDDLDGRRVSLWANYFALSAKALFAKHKVRIREIPQGISMALFLNRAVEASNAMAYNELHRLYQAGLDRDEVQVFSLAKLGFNFPEDGIYALEKTWREKPDTCRRFIKATLEGWRRALAQPEQALESVMKRIKVANLASNMSHQRWMLKNFAPLVVPKGFKNPLGHLSPKDYDALCRVLLDNGLIFTKPAYKDFAVPAWKAAE